VRAGIKLALIGGATVAVLMGMAGPATADPASTPAGTDYTTTGSDTLQGVEGLGNPPPAGTFQNDYNAQSPAPAHSFWSFDATGGGNVTLKSGCTAITRPNGSGAGISTLGANATDGSGHYCANLARASRDLKTGDPTGLSSYKLAHDAVSWSAVSGGNAPANLTGAQLAHIFLCTAGYTTWNGTGLGNGTGSSDTIVPVLPQSQSGTRAFFLQALNGALSLGGSLVPGSCVNTTEAPEENEGTDAIFNNGVTGVNSNDVVFPYSAAVFAAQADNGHSTTTQQPDNLTIRNLDSNANGPIVVKGANHVANANFSSSFVRFVYTIVRTAAVGSSTTDDGNVYADLVNSKTGWFCSAAAQADQASYGFATLGAFCGTFGSST
jgi:hypothetical protein